MILAKDNLPQKLLTRRCTVKICDISCKFIKILSGHATGRREEICPTAKSVVDSNRSIQNKLIQNNIKKIQTLLQQFLALK